MRRTDPAQLVNVATLLRPILDELVFVGGAVTSLLVTVKALVGSGLHS